MARGRRTQLSIDLSAEVRGELERYQRCTSISAGLARRARLVLLLASGVSVSDVSRLVGMQRRHVYKWAERFQALQLAGLADRRRGASRRQDMGNGPSRAPVPRSAAAG